MLFVPFKSDTAAQLAAVSQRMLTVTAALGNPRSSVSLAIAHHLRTPGSRVRSQIALHAANCMNLDTQSAIALATCCELLHNASLIHDDLQDRDQLRRGRQAVWSLYGADVALCAGDLLLSGAYAALTAVTEVATLPEMLAQMHLAVGQTVHGQMSAGLPPHKNIDWMTTYEAMAAAKSGPLLNLPFSLVFSYCHQPHARDLAAHAVRAFAIAYQISDDLEDVEADERTVLGCAANIIIGLETAKNCERVTAQKEAARLAGGKLAEALAIAAKLPDGTGAILSDLGLRITYKLNGYL